MAPLLQRLKERKLFQWALAYLAGAWLVLQGIEVLAEPWNLSQSIIRAIHVLLGIGFGLALVLAWYHGERGRQRVSGPELLMIAALLVIAGSALSLVRVEEEAPSASAAAGLPRRGSAKPAIAVLPCDNISPNPEDAYLADGIHEEILLRLSKIQSLASIGRKSVEWYRDNPRPIREMAIELGVGFVGECSVRKDADQNRIRLTFQLLDARTGGQIWAENYDRDLTAGNLLEMESDVAGQVAHTLRAVLTPEERAQIEAVPTENPEAYDYYLRGIEYLRRPGFRPEDFRHAQRMLEQAVELDPRFALAHAELSSLHTSFYHAALDRSEERERQSREAAERALQIDPDLPEGHLALGHYYYLIHRDYDRALEEFAIAERGLPGEVTLLHWRGSIWRRQGRWEQALASLERAVALSPREPDLLFELGETYPSLHRYEEAETCFDRVLEFQPDYVEAALLKAFVPLWSNGDTGPLRTLVDGIPPGFDPLGLVTVLHWLVEYYDRDYAAALEVVSHSELEYFEWPGFSAPGTLLMGLGYAAMGESELARAAGDSARRDLEARLGERPDDPRLLVAMSQAHAILGNKEEAVRQARRAVELMPISKDAMDGPDYVRYLAGIYAWFGEVDAAVEQYELYLSVPTPGSVKYVLLDPAIDPVRDDPRFQELVEKYE